MTTLKQGTGRALALILAGVALASCMAHGQGRKLDPKVYVNHSPYGEAFYRELMTGRVNVFAGLGRFGNAAQGLVYASDGTVIECSGRLRLDNKLHWIGLRSTRWSLVNKPEGVATQWGYGGRHKLYAWKFYNPATGAFNTEVWQSGRWIVGNLGQIQDTWPRALADACPDLKLPAHIRINEKQTSLRFDELRRQDPDAPIRHFPGSHLTAPGRTGLGASGGKPTTSRKEVWTFLHGQEGYVVRSASETGYVLGLARGGSTGEVWRLADDGSIAATGVLREQGDWIFIEIPGQPVLRYPMGYPVPVLPTVHRHAAWQLTDKLIARGEPLPLPWMGERYAGHRFLFHDKTLTIVAPGDRYLEGRWRWTRGCLEVTVEGDERNPVSIAWRDLARELGATPKVWTPATPDRL